MNKNPRVLEVLEMANLPLPLLIGAGMIAAGLGLGIYIAVKAVNASRKNNPLD